MIEIKLENEQNGYEAVGDYIRKYWDEHGVDDVILCIEQSYDGIKYYKSNQIAEVVNSYTGELVFVNDWWEGEKYIRILGIKNVGELDIVGSI